MKDPNTEWRASPALTGSLRTDVSVSCRLAATTLLVCLGSACSAQTVRDAELSARDSAGIQVLESTGRPSETWRLSPVPEVELGGGDTDELFRVRGAVLLSDGRIGVANGGSGEIRLYSRDGRLLGSAGRMGGGPGEFAALSGFAVTSHDTVLAFDALGRRLSIFAPDGRFARSVRLEPVRGYTPVFTPVGWLGTGEFVVRARKEGQQTNAAGTVSERTDQAVILFGLDGAAQSVLGPFVGAERVIHVSGDGGSFSIRSVALPFQKDLLTAAAESVVAVGNTDRYEFRLYGSDGELRRIVREARVPRKVTSADVDAWVAHRFGAEPGSIAFRERRRQYDELQIPDSHPVFEALRLDGAGRLWVREYEPAPEEVVSWRVFDPGACMLAEITMPSAFQPFHIGEDFVLGTWTDDLDVERIRLYRLHRSAGARG